MADISILITNVEHEFSIVAGVREYARHRGKQASTRQKTDTVFEGQTDPAYRLALTKDMTVFGQLVVTGLTDEGE